MQEGCYKKRVINKKPETYEYKIPRITELLSVVLCTAKRSHMLCLGNVHK